ncbi:hypothetical protein [Nonomuraea harbinensis]|uniref:Uncharacterized protein n=1 Tax=Nonomuraea harbinensis TaxID=1286938 RepID=A0ABW1C218_9ACTN
MPSIPVYELIDEAQRCPSPLAGERKLPILVFTGDALPTGTAVETAECFKLRVPYAEVNADETDVATIVDRLAGEPRPGSRRIPWASAAPCGGRCPSAGRRTRSSTARGGRRSTGRSRARTS